MVLGMGRLTNPHPEQRSERPNMTEGAKDPKSICMPGPDFLKFSKIGEFPIAIKMR